ncbi:MAG: hypothetical protein DSO02_02065 [Hadesarchaea archaeon]|nr:MAG: hypothetical protein DSO02_02065 [Hadesarchaea archaeon]
MEKGGLGASLMYVAIFAGGGIIGSLASSFFLMMEDLGTNPLGMGFLAAAPLLGLSLLGLSLMLWWKRLVTREGFGRMVALLMAGTALAGLSCPLKNFWLLGASRILLGTCSMGLVLLLLVLSLEWFMERLNLMVLMGILSLLLGTLFSSFFGSLLTHLLGGWEKLPLFLGLLAGGCFLLWLLLGPFLPLPDGGHTITETLQTLKNPSLFHSSLMLYTFLAYLGVFSFIFVKLPGSWELALLSKEMIFSLPFYLAAAAHSLLVVLASPLFLSLASERGRRRSMCLISGLLSPLFGLLTLNLPFSDGWMVLILESITLALLQLSILLPLWILLLQELPGVSLENFVPSMGGILFLSGAMGGLATLILGWALFHGWSTFRIMINLLALSWGASALGGYFLTKEEME